jgi:AraC-like DNA-binding protein
MQDWQFSIFPNETFIDLSLYQYGGEVCKPSHLFGPATRNHYLFHYILRGKGVLSANNDKGAEIKYHLKAGDGFMIFPGQVTMYIADEQDPWEYMWIEFDGLRVKEALDTVGLTISSPIYHYMYEDLHKEMVKNMVYIATSKNATPFDLIGHLYLVLDNMMRSIKVTEQHSGNRLVDFYMHETMVFIEQNYMYNISIEDIANNIGLNRSYFGKLFKRETGKTPQSFLLNYRMIKACEYLKRTEMHIADISQAVGYENQLHFSRAFKNVYGLSPMQWRKANRER